MTQTIMQGVGNTSVHDKTFFIVAQTFLPVSVGAGFKQRAQTRSLKPLKPDLMGFSEVLSCTKGQYISDLA